MPNRKSALVTGASSGIGRQYAIFLAKSGYDIVAVARRVELLEALATELKAYGAETKVVVADLSTDDGIQALADSSTVATLLPGTGLFLGKPQANGRKFLDHGVKVAIASDYNPGSCHCDNLMMVASLAAPIYKMNIAELWAAITLNASHALGLYDQGHLSVGLKPRFTIFNTDSIDRITYNWGKNLARN